MGRKGPGSDSWWRCADGSALDETKLRRIQQNAKAKGRGTRPRVSGHKVCSFCAEHIDSIDYKEVSRLRRFLSESGKILPRRRTGTCAKHQRPLTAALKRARAIALLP